MTRQRCSEVPGGPLHLTWTKAPCHGADYRESVNMTNRAMEYIEANKDRFLGELQEFLRFPSVSSQTAHKPDVMACANWLVGHLGSIGLDARLIETDGHPIVEAKGTGATGRKLIIYGHYDVQPAELADGWETPPFEPCIRDGWIVGRGTTDDKGQLFAHIKAVESLIRTTGPLPCDLRFLIEGEEECGGDSLKKYVEREKTNLAPDAVVISDTTLYDERTPAITYALRGLVGLEVTVRVAGRDLHSGAYGGGIGNPAIALAHMIGACMGADGVVRIPGFYEQVRPLEDWETQTIERLAFDERTLLEEAGARTTFGEAGRSILERMWARPTFEVNGIFGGYSGGGMKTIIPASATAKISMRLVPDQDPKQVFEQAAGYLRSQCPPYATVEIKGPLGAAPPVLFDVKDPAIKTGRQALESGFGAEPVLIRCGGSIPVAGTFWKELAKPVILMGFGLDSDGAHSANERFKVANFVSGTKTSAHFITAFAG